ncbi:hypothetical protein CC85DRAFT_76045 [Cutaneotrichosporon oleaginosum]|uniref:Uncharacterized protein n=1 Tax=Cutaneotrichosporon oleaginosum TaxID=879819 RepID=A0A0J0XNX2_9TREE|nr:uncharacterized protein CC85DRAFT_76045 [Cutaneotrichosporon oleaginosum]KLT42846.1 hypothetical protein CC85DRAFT_76045 [Cutaneotrichosporon oleaginosum]
MVSGFGELPGCNMHCVRRSNGGVWCVTCLVTAFAITDHGACSAIEHVNTRLDRCAGMAGRPCVAETPRRLGTRLVRVAFVHLVPLHLETGTGLRRAPPRTTDTFAQLHL